MSTDKSDINDVFFDRSPHLSLNGAVPSDRLQRKRLSRSRSQIQDISPGQHHVPIVPLHRAQDPVADIYNRLRVQAR